MDTPQPDSHQAEQPATPPAPAPTSEPAAAPAIPPAPQPKPKPEKPLKPAAPKIFTLKTFGILAVIILLLGFLAGWAAAPNAPKDGGNGDTAREIASLRLAMEASNSSATEVAELRSKLASAEAAHRTAEFALGDAKTALKEAEATQKTAEEKAATAETAAKEMESVLEGFQSLEIPEGFALPEGTARLWGSK